MKNFGRSTIFIFWIKFLLLGKYRIMEVNKNVQRERERKKNFKQMGVVVRMQQQF